MTESTNAERLTPLDVLRRDGWTQRQRHSPEGHCMSGALDIAFATDSVAWNLWHDEISDVCREQFPLRSHRVGRPDAPLVYVNDHPDTTLADVEMVIEKAQIRLSERVA